MCDFYTKKTPLRDNPHRCHKYASSHHVHHVPAHTSEEGEFLESRYSSYKQQDCWAFSHGHLQQIKMSKSQASTIQHLEETTSHWIMAYMKQIKEGELKSDFIFGKRSSASPRTSPNSLLSILSTYGQ